MKPILKTGRIIIKRKHTDAHPAICVTKNGKIRNEILNHIQQCGGECSIEDLQRFTKALQTKLKLSYDPANWHKKFTKYVGQKNVDEKEIVFLTNLGRNFAKIVING